jgi:hypothetical protein
MKNEVLFGIEQCCACNQSPNHIYVAPSFMCISQKYYDCIGRTSFNENNRSDVGQEITHISQELNKKVEFFNFSFSKNYKWRLGFNRMFGNGSNYSNNIYHQYEIRNVDQQQDFINECVNLCLH